MRLQFPETILLLKPVEEIVLQKPVRMLLIVPDDNVFDCPFSIAHPYDVEDKRLHLPDQIAQFVDDPPEIKLLVPPTIKLLVELLLIVEIFELRIEQLTALLDIVFVYPARITFRVELTLLPEPPIMTL